MRVLRKAEKKAEAKPQLKTRLGELEQLLGVPPKFLHKHLHDLGPRQSAARAVVVNKPRDLTRAQLKNVKLLLDNAGYSEASAAERSTQPDQ